MNVPAQALILVADGRKAMVLRNKGDAKFPNLKSEWVVVDQNPSTSSQGTDRPGRVNFQERRSSVDQTDWHAAEETAFAKRAAQALEDIVHMTDARHVVLVAPPRTLAVLRRSLRQDTLQKVIAELPRDLVNFAIAEIENHLGCVQAAS
jgi:protein required for attachment to host cells